MSNVLDEALKLSLRSRYGAILMVGSNTWALGKHVTTRHVHLPSSFDSGSHEPLPPYRARIQTSCVAHERMVSLDDAICSNQANCVEAEGRLSRLAELPVPFVCSREKERFAPARPCCHVGADAV